MRVKLLGLILLAMSQLAVPAVALARDNVVTTSHVDDPSTVNMTGDANTTAGNAQAPPKAAKPVETPTQKFGSEVFGKSVMILVQLFVIAVILESALALIFTWLPFEALLNTRTVKPLLSFLAALLLTTLFDTQIVAKVLRAYGGAPGNATGLLGQVLDAMIIAGGSSGVHQMLSRLGIRTPTLADAAKRPPPSKAWLSVALKRSDGVMGAVQVQIAPIVNGIQQPWQTCGTISGNPLSGFARFFLRDRGRFPQNGGWAVDAGMTCNIRLTGFDSTGAVKTGAEYGEITFSPGAIVDLDLTL